jgi:hypothetical protein
MSSTGEFNTDMTDLRPDTIYYYRAVAEGSETVYGEEKSFITGASSFEWGYRVEITLDHSRIDNDLVNFPVLINLSPDCGMNGADLTAVFDEVGENSKKIAVTEDNGISQLYVEVEKWDSAAKEAWLWVSRPGWTISSVADTILYLYYDNSHEENTTYVGDKGSAPAQMVWDEGSKIVQHLGESGSGLIGEFRDSTANGHDGTGDNGSSDGTPVRVASIIGDGQMFDGVDDYIEMPDDDDYSVPTTGQLTISYWLSPAVQNMTTESWGYIHFIGKGSVGAYEWAFRLYNADYNQRPQALAIYHWNPTGGSGAGSRWDHENWPNNTWVYVTAVFGGLHNDIALYGNGELVDNDNYADYNIIPVNGPGSLRLGTRDTDGDWLNGRLDEFRISSVARSDAWIKACFNSESNNLLNIGTPEILTRDKLEFITLPVPRRSDLYRSHHDSDPGRIRQSA